VSIGFSQIELRDIHVGPDDVVADEIDVRFSLPNLRLGSIDSLAIRGLRVRAHMGDDGLSFGTLDALRKSEGESETPRTRVLVPASRPGAGSAGTGSLKLRRAPWPWAPDIAFARNSGRTDRNDCRSLDQAGCPR
jgi:hypothetical protein